MSFIITSQSVVAYSQCAHKAFLLQGSDEKGAINEYEKVIQKRKIETQSAYVEALRGNQHDIVSYTLELFQNGPDYLLNALLRTKDLQAECDLLEKYQSENSSYHLPIIFTGTHKIAQSDKFRLLFAGYVLGEVQGRQPEIGKIIRMGQKRATLKLKDLFKKIAPFLRQLRAWKTADEPRPIILNQHCPYCQFYDQCRTQAEKTDHLSLLAGISTLKLINKYERKGIFTVNQLSYLYRPRKQRKRARKTPALLHSLELQALMIRTGKIYLKEPPAILRMPIELFLDIEGIPDQQSFYLIGLLICENNNSTYHPFWADNLKDEASMWEQFIEMLHKYPDCPIYHYGSYDAKAISALGKRYQTDIEKTVMRLVNLITYVYGKIYFPLHSNGIKEIGRFLGMSRSSLITSGVQSLVWRYHWEETQEETYKKELLLYNQEDCQTVKVLMDFLSKANEREDALIDIDCFVHSKKSRSTRSGNPLHRQLETILRFAHSDYHRYKICFREDKNDEKNDPKSSPKVIRRKYKHRRATRIIQIPSMMECPYCGSRDLKKCKRTVKKYQVDFVFTKNSVRKTVIKYWAHITHCLNCHDKSMPEMFIHRGRTKIHGYGLKKWIVYQRVALRLSYANIVMILEEMFDEPLTPSQTTKYLQDVGQEYIQTEDWMIQQLLESSFLHVDETSLNIDYVNKYVWVFTNGKYVILKYTETREASFVQEFLKGYKGVLISDFYPGYDALKCRHQKCLAHLIRDLNNDLYTNPFDSEFQQFVSSTKNLIVPIMEAVQRYGLKKWHLKKFKKAVDKFYAATITDRLYKSDLCSKYQARFIRYRDHLFTFLEYDGIPWHNNTAENALRHIALQEKISGVFHSSVFEEYLLLLGIRQSCKFQKLSFLKFLISEKKMFENIRS